MEKKTLTPEETSKKLDELEQQLATLTKERDDALKEKDDLQKKLNGLRIDGLVKKVEPKEEVKEDEDIEFDFDI